MSYMTHIIMSVLFVALSAAWVNADTISIETVGDRDGYAWSGGVNTSGNIVYAGDIHPSVSYYVAGVVKYDLPAELDNNTVNSATLNVRVISHAPAAGEDEVWILLQKFTFDNATAVAVTDWSTSSVTNIGVLSADVGSPYWMQWDVASQVQSDVNDDYDYSSYRLIAVTSETDFTPVQLANTHNVAFESQEGPNGLEPRLDIDYDPVFFATNIETVGDRDGYAWESGANTNGNIVYAGDIHPSMSYYVFGVVKYDLPVELDDNRIHEATLNVRFITHAPAAGEDEVWILLQKYTFDNVTAVAVTDWSTSSVTNIGVLSADVGSPYWMQWDVASQVQSDVNDDYDYSSYRLIAVTSETDFTPVKLVDTHYVAFESQEGPNGLEPRLDVSYYIPPKGTLIVVQ